MKQDVALLRGHHIRCSRRKMIFLLRQQKVSDRGRRSSSFLVALLGHHARHGGTRFDAMRITDGWLKIGQVHPRTDFSKTRCFFRAISRRRFSAMTSRAIQLLNQNVAFELRLQLT